MKIEVSKIGKNDISFKLVFYTNTVETHSKVQSLDLEGEIKKQLQVAAVNIIAEIEYRRKEKSN